MTKEEQNEIGYKINDCFPANTTTNDYMIIVSAFMVGVFHTCPENENEDPEIVLAYIDSFCHSMKQIYADFISKRDQK